MKHLDLAISAPLCLVIVFCGLALLGGTEPWTLAKGLAIWLPVLAYVGFSVFTAIMAMKIGEIGLTQKMTFQAKFYFYHGMSVIATVVLAAAGSFIILFARQLGAF